MKRFILTILLCWTGEAGAQSSFHFLQSANDPPGSVARTQARHVSSLQGYFQPVEVQVPDAATIAVANAGLFDPFQSTIKVGLLVGHIYRLKVAEIQNHPSVQVYPTLEIINRLYPPEGLAERFPVAVQITQRDLEDAIAGRLVVRVIYVEDPNRPFPGGPDDPRITHALPDEDPLHVADELGRPIAILRIGSRTPDPAEDDQTFLFGSPPVTILTGSDAAVSIGVESGVVPGVQNYSEQVHGGSPSTPCFINVSSDDSNCPVFPSGLPPGFGSSSIRPADEYICDGGDASVHVAVDKNWQVRGLDPEDTVGHFDTLDGRTLVQPSNRVCIYAPRFCAVQKVLGAFADQAVVEPGRFLSPLSAAEDRQRDLLSDLNQPLSPEGDVSFASTLTYRDRTRAVEFENRRPVREMRNVVEAYQELQVMHLGVFRESQRALLAERSEAALVWTEAVAPEVLIDNVLAIADVTIQKPAIAYSIDESGHPRLRLIKIASTQAALPGEEIEFSLRFDNTGDQPIGNVTIIDRLTARLEYIQGSAECDRKAEFSYDPNANDSLTLRWDITDPLRPGEGGVIRFRCRML
jgi:uncharacterized repeat protein (TIGR01451 family)